MTAPDPPLPAVFTHAEALRAGLTASQIKTRARNAAWTTLRRGVYCRTAVWAATDRPGRHLLCATAAIRVTTGPVWLSHASGAAVHRLPLPRADDRVWMTRQPPAHTAYRGGIQIEAATLLPAEQRASAGLAVTELARTVADCVRHLPPPDGLAIADAALRRDPTMAEKVSAVLARCEDWPFVERGRVVLGAADGRRESPLESWSFWIMKAYGLPMPEPQVDLYDVDGRFLGRCDAWWWEHGVAGEADGRVKYAVPSADDLGRAQRALVDEKLREDAIRRAGAGVIRWGSTELQDPRTWAARVRHELHQHGPSRFRGRAVPTHRPLAS